MKQPFLFRYLYIFYSAVFLIHIVNVFIDSEKINYLIGLLAILMFILSFAGATRLFKILGLSFLIVGGYLFLLTKQPISTLPTLLTSNMALLTLLCMLPWMSSVVWSGRFDRSLNSMMKFNVTDLGQLYVRSTATTLTMA